MRDPIKHLPLSHGNLAWNVCLCCHAFVGCFEYAEGQLLTSTVECRLCAEVISRWRTLSWIDGAAMNPAAEQKENCHKYSQSNCCALHPCLSFTFCLLVIEIISYLWKPEQRRMLSTGSSQETWTDRKTKQNNKMRAFNSDVLCSPTSFNQQSLSWASASCLLPLLHSQSPRSHSDFLPLTDLFWWTSWISFLSCFWFRHNDQICFLLYLDLCPSLSEVRNTPQESVPRLWRNASGLRRIIHVKLREDLYAPQNRCLEIMPPTYWKWGNKHCKKYIYFKMVLF